MRYVLCALSLYVLTMSACTKKEVQETLCDTGKMAASAVATKMATELSCTNMTAIKADIEAQLGKMKVCEGDEAKSKVLNARSAIGNVVCASLVETMFAGAISQIPTTWGCSGGQKVEDAKAKLMEACSNSL